MVGLLARTFRGGASAGGGPTLLGGDLLAAPGLSRGVLLCEPRSFGKGLGSLAERQGQALSRQAGHTRRALGAALAVGGVAEEPRRGSPIARFIARLALGEPAVPRPLAVGLVILDGRLTPSRRMLAPIRRLLTPVGGPLSLIRDRLAFIGDSVTLVGGLLALVRQPLALCREARPDRRLAPVTITLATYPVTIALQELVIGLELSRASVDVRAQSLDRGPSGLIVLLLRAGAELPQLAPGRVELRELTLQGGAAPFEPGPLGVASRLPDQRCCLVACCALLVHEARPDMYRAVRARAHGRFHIYALSYLGHGS
jgi:hypothetical protein